MLLPRGQAQPGRVQLLRLTARAGARSKTSHAPPKRWLVFVRMDIHKGSI